MATLAGLLLLLGCLAAGVAVLRRLARTLPAETPPLVDRLDAVLPQTQCGQCGYPGCRPYATAIAAGEADIDDPEAAAKLLLSIVIGDSMLHTLAGLEDEWLDNDQLDWRLQPFLSHFKIV